MYKQVLAKNEVARTWEYQPLRRYAVDGCLGQWTAGPGGPPERTTTPIIAV